MQSSMSIEGVELEMYSNTEDERVIANCESAMARVLPELSLLPATEIPICIVGGGPSIEAEHKNIYDRWRDGAHVWALNGAHDWLMSHGITPHAAWCVDSLPQNVEFYRRPSYLTHYFLSSRVDPGVFDALAKYNVTLWYDASCKNIVPASKLLVGGGTTIGMKAMAGAYVRGYRNLHLFGLDSCYSDTAHHAYDQPWNNGEGVYQVAIADRVFTCAPWMLNQIKNFGLLAPKLAEEGCTVEVHGDSALKWAAMDYMRQMREAEAAVA